MPSVRGVRPLARNEIAEAAETLALAFHDAPLFMALLPSSAARRRWLRWFHVPALNRCHGRGVYGRRRASGGGDRHVSPRNVAVRACRTPPAIQTEQSCAPYTDRLLFVESRARAAPLQSQRNMLMGDLRSPRSPKFVSSIEWRPVGWCLRTALCLDGERRERRIEHTNRLWFCGDELNFP
jgi:hypothetical protein